MQPVQKVVFFFAGYQPVLSGQQGFQGLIGVQQPPQSQSVMSNQPGAPVQSVMVSYPAMSSYQVHISSLGNLEGLESSTGQSGGCEYVPCWVVSGVVGAMPSPC